MASRKNKVLLNWNNNFAYAIGVIATDGNLSPDLRHLHITSKDQEMLINCKKMLGNQKQDWQKRQGWISGKEILCLAIW